VRRSGKNGERAEEVRGNKKRPARVEPLRPQAEHIRKFPNDLAKFPEENPHPVLRVHKDGIVLYANKASEPILKAKNSGVGLPAPSEWRRLVEAVLASGRMVREEVEYNGHIFEFLAVPIAETDYVNFYGDDITERKRTEQALRETTQTLEAVIQASPLPIFAVDRERIVKTWNPAAERTFGWSAQEAIGRRYPAIPKEKMDEADALFSRALESGLTEVETLRQRKDGSLIDVSISAAPLRDSRGNINGVMAVLTDITDRKKAEEELRKFKTISEKAGYGVSIVDLEGNVIYNNAAYDRMHGYTPGELIGKHLSTFHTEQQMANVNRLIEQLNREGNYVSQEVWHKRNDNTEFPTLMNGTLIKDENGTPLFMAATVVDITERKQAEEALKQSEEKFRALFEHMDAASCLDEVIYEDGKAVDYRILDINPSFERIIGIGRAQAVGMLASQVYGLGAAPFLDIYAKVAETGEPSSFEAFFPPIGKHLHITSFCPAKGRFSNMFIDITERKRAEETLRKSEEKYRGLVENSPNIVAIYQEGALKYVNQIMCEKLGWTFQEMTSPSFNPVEKIIPQRFQSLLKENIAKRLRGENIPPYEISIKTRDGSEIPVIVNAQAILYHGKPADEVIHTDITEHKKAEEKIIEYQKQLKQLTSQLALTEERERRRIAGKLHDQLCQSLALAKIKLDALGASATPRAANEILTDASDTLQFLIDQTRSLIFDLSSPILYELGFEAAVAEWLNEQVRDKGGIETEFQDDGQPKSLDDDVRMLLFRNVRELLINVIKHSRASKVKVSIRRTDDSIEITVEDNGVGFNPAEAKTMAAKTAKFGLFSIRESVEQLGGRFEIESKPDAGCKATIAAPLKGKSRQKEG
jgi:PAS domain S-box-containing protein